MTKQEFEINNPKETFNVGDVVYNKDGNKLTIYDIIYKTSDFLYYEASELSHQNPLKEITEKELAEIGYVLKKWNTT